MFHCRMSLLLLHVISATDGMSRLSQDCLHDPVLPNRFTSISCHFISSQLIRSSYHHPRVYQHSQHPLDQPHLTQGRTACQCVPINVTCTAYPSTSFHFIPSYISPRFHSSSRKGARSQGRLSLHQPLLRRRHGVLNTPSTMPHDISFHLISPCTPPSSSSLDAYPRGWLPAPPQSP